VIDDSRGRKMPDAREPSASSSPTPTPTPTPAPSSSPALDEQTIALDALADAVLNGDDLDWPAAEARFAGDPEQQALVRQLAILARVRHVAPEEADVNIKHEADGNAKLDADSSPWQHLIIQEEVGRGGFGVVYRAWDSRLQREVALKLLKPGAARGAFTSPSLFSAIVDEGRLLASVRHPHVVTVYDAARHGETVGVWMEFVRGRTLAEMVRADGPFGPHETTAIGIALCGAVSAIHHVGLLHQDIKADNVMRERGGRIVLMDFGAAAVAAAPPGALARGLFGSPHYLAPELLAGAAASSKQSDIYSLGVLLFFLLAGSFPVDGDDLDAIRDIHRRGERRLLRDVRPDVPLPLAVVVERCLAADPEARFASVGALEQALDATAVATTPVDGAARARDRRGWRVLASVMAAASIAFVTAALTWLWLSAGTTDDRVAGGARTAFDVTVPGAANIEALALSPDGRALAIVAQDTSGLSGLWLRRFDSPAVVFLDGSQGAAFPFWSPDGLTIAFFADGALKKISASGGGVQVLCPAPLGRGGTWSRGGDILFAPTSTSGLSRISAAGGAVTPVTRLNPYAGQHSHRWPQFLPDGRRFLYLGLMTGGAGGAIFVASLDNPGEPRRLLQATSNVALLGARHLIVTRERSLIAQPIEPTRVELAGESALVANTLAFLEDRRAGVFSASVNGTLAWWSHPAPRTRIVWLDRAGQPAEPPREIEGRVANVALSPDNQRLAIQRLDPATGTDDIWVFDRSRESLTRLTTEPTNETDPVWSPDSLSLLFSSNRTGPYQLFLQRLDRGGPPARIGSGDGDLPTFPEDWSPRHDDVIVVQGREGDRQLRRISMRSESDRGDGPTPATPLVEDRYVKDEPRESPDGRFVAYHSTISGRPEVYVIGLESANGANGTNGADRAPRKWQVSIDGGVQARWSETGDELFFLGLDGTLQVAARQGDAGWQRPRLLFHTGLSPHLTLEQYAVARDGQRFLFALPVADPVGPVSVVINAIR
jgi:eukaryotic-like serine/threonine-protein kinase